MQEDRGKEKLKVGARTDLGYQAKPPPTHTRRGNVTDKVRTSGEQYIIATTRP